MKRRGLVILLVAAVILAFVKMDLPTKVFGESALFSSEKKIQRHFANVEAKKSDESFLKRDKIGKDDKHFGFEIGQFVFSGYTRIEDDGQGNLLVIKGEDDEVHLTFDLRKDIDRLKGEDNFRVNSDLNGSDEEFGYAQPSGGFGRGMLLWQFTNSEGYKAPVQAHRDYLVALTTDNAEKDIVMNEEGDWEIALDYELIYPVLAWNGYSQYTIRMNVKVRNANCMAYMREVETDRELRDSEMTKKGFYIDLANSKYLKIDVSRTNIGENDIRNNSPYTDGTAFTDSGVYTITVLNEYTGAKTIKKIIVNAD